jgi:hypothetical protein
MRFATLLSASLALLVGSVAASNVIDLDDNNFDSVSSSTRSGGKTLTKLNRSSEKTSLLLLSCEWHTFLVYALTDVPLVTHRERILGSPLA